MGASGEVSEWLVLKTSGEFAKANEYYEKTLYPIVEQRFLSQAGKAGGVGAYDALLLPLGEKWHHSVLLIKLLRPKRVYFICTKEVEQSTLGKVVEMTGLAQQDYKKDIVEYFGMDLPEVHEKVTAAIMRLKQLGAKSFAVDLTRGKRIMTAGLGIAGALNGCDFVYIDEDWNSDINDGMPCTERLTFVKNPYKIFGDVEMKNAKELFNNNGFYQSAQVFVGLSKSVRDPRECIAYQTFAEAYAQWDMFNYRAALVKLRDANTKAGQFCVQLPPIDKNFAALIELEELQSRKQRFYEIIKNTQSAFRLIADAYANAMRRAENQRFDDAISRLYRLIEIVSQHRLALLGFDCASPDFTVLSLDGLQERYQEVTQKIYGTKKELPNAVTLVDGHILLFLLQDETWKSRTTIDLQNLVNEVKARDHSMSAHGVRSVGHEDFLKLKAEAKKFAQILFAQSNEEFDKMLEQHVFPRL